LVYKPPEGRDACRPDQAGLVKAALTIKSFHKALSTQEARALAEDRAGNREGPAARSRQPRGKKPSRRAMKRDFDFL
jgi:hypothetical protein